MPYCVLMGLKWLILMVFSIAWDKEKVCPVVKERLPRH